MQYTTSFAAFLAATMATTGMVSASPLRVTSPVTAGTISANVNANAQAGTASLKQVRNEDYQHHHGVLALEKAYLKYNAALPDDVSNAVSRIRGKLADSKLAGLKDLDNLLGLDISKKKGKRDTGSAVPVPGKNDIEYLTPVQIGTPPQTLNLDFDTGSSDLWVYSSNTPKKQVKGQSVYDPKASITSSLQGNLSWSISYGDGSASEGNVYYDTVAVGGLVVPNQAVEAATDVSSEFTADSELDGLLGLGFDNLNAVYPRAQKTFFSQAKSQLDSYVFTADLKAGEPGTYNFGYIDDSAYTGSIGYAPVDSSLGYWMFNSTGYKVGSGEYQAKPINGIADTGTTLLLLPGDIVTAYYAGVKSAAYEYSQGGYVFPCNSTLPDFSFGVGAATITVPGTYLNYSSVDGAAGNSTCYGGIQDDTLIGFSIFGDIALKSAFVVFDGDKNQIGWASKNL